MFVRVSPRFMSPLLFISQSVEVWRERARRETTDNVAEKEWLRVAIPPPLFSVKLDSNKHEKGSEENRGGQSS